RSEAGVGRARLVNLRNARMLQTTEGLRFLLEAAQEFGVGQPGLEDLERNGAPRMILFRLVDRAHAPFADDADDAIAGNRRREVNDTGPRAAGVRRHRDVRLVSR